MVFAFAGDSTTTSAFAISLDLRFDQPSEFKNGRR